MIRSGSIRSDPDFVDAVIFQPFDKFLRHGVDGENLMCFVNEKSVYKSLQLSVNLASTFTKLKFESNELI